MSVLRRAAVASIALALILLTEPTHPAVADSFRDKQWHLKFLEVPKAHAVTKGAGVVVAVVDTGVSPHPDLRRNLLQGADVIAGQSGNGQSDKSGHGTAMAGLIAGHGSNERDGILGIAPEAKILPVQVSTKEDVGNNVTLAAGIDWSTRHGAQVINVSASSAPGVLLTDAIQQAADADALVVAGSGNHPDFSRIGYPAATDGVLAVGAVDRAGKHAAYSVEAEQVQLCAPGTDIESTGLKSGYRVGNGTSDSTAIVSGAAALVRAKFPDLSAPQVIERLTSTATDIGPPGRDKECGFGVLDIVKALTADGPVGSGSASVPATTATTAAPNPGAGQAAPDGDEGSVAVVAGLVSGGVVVVGGLIAFLVARRRRAF